MIQKLKQTENYRSFLQTDTSDVIMQGSPDGRLIGMATGVTHFDGSGYYEVIIRGENNPRYEAGSIAGHLNHKRAICCLVKGYTDDEVGTLSETDLDGILNDYAKADIRTANSDSTTQNNRKGRKPHDIQKN